MDRFTVLQRSDHGGWQDSQHPGHEVLFPPGTSYVEFDFNAVEISSPENIRKQYRLDGVDSEWLDAGTNPHAIYSTMPVGTHTVDIRAYNRNGIGDRQGVLYHHAETLFLTSTFVRRSDVRTRSSAGRPHLRFRVRQVSPAMSVRFDERLAELV